MKTTATCFYAAEISLFEHQVLLSQTISPIYITLTPAEISVFCQASDIFPTETPVGDETKRFQIILWP